MQETKFHPQAKYAHGKDRGTEMNKKRNPLPAKGIRLIALAAFVAAVAAGKAKDPVDYVDPNIGGIAHLLVATAPLVQMPHGVVALAYNPWPETLDRYTASKISSFSMRTLPRYSITPLPTWIMATTGELRVDEARASFFDHDSETVTPYYSSVWLEDYDIQTEYTVTEHAGYYRFTFPQSLTSTILIGNNESVEIASDHVIQSVEVMKGMKAYFYIEFSKPISVCGTWKNGKILSELKEQSGNSVGAFTRYSTAQGEHINVKIGVSFIDMDQARENLEREIPAWDFERVKIRAKGVWNNALNKIQVEGGTEKQRTIFYSALYRVMLGSQSMNLTEYGRYFSPYDHKVHTTAEQDVYLVGSNWGSCHSLFPLFLLLEPEKQNALLRSYVLAEEQCNWISTSGGNHGMIGHHECATITDAYMKGFRDFNLEKAYEGMKRNAMETTMLSRHLGTGCAATELDRVYFEKGFFPALAPGEKEWVPQVGFNRQSVSLTLENCYDDWCIAVMAKALGKEDDYRYFLKRAHNYQNLFDPRLGFMRPKTADGQWIEPYDPIWSGGQGGRDYFTENNGWDYTWFVPHDVQGLIQLIGGGEKFLAKLNQLFSTELPVYQKFTFLGQFPDMTGLIGMYAHGNEPTWHIPYLYNYGGAPWLTQKRVRNIMNIWYSDEPLGMSGDEDYGEMSSWYVLSAVGFYTVCPGRPVYDIGSPIFKKAILHIGNGKTFVIEAKGVSARNKYIQSAKLNGRALNQPWFQHADLKDGGTLTLQMGPKPNKSWGSAPEAAPPSMTAQSGISR